MLKKNFFFICKRYKNGDIESVNIKFEILGREGKFELLKGYVNIFI